MRALIYILFLAAGSLQAAMSVPAHVVKEQQEKKRQEQRAAAEKRRSNPQHYCKHPFDLTWVDYPIYSTSVRKPSEEVPGEDFRYVHTRVKEQKNSGRSTYTVEKIGSWDKVNMHKALETILLCRKEDASKASPLEAQFLKDFTQNWLTSAEGSGRQELMSRYYLAGEIVGKMSDPKILGPLWEQVALHQKALKGEKETMSESFKKLILSLREKAMEENALSEQEQEFLQQLAMQQIGNPTAMETLLGPAAIYFRYLYLYGESEGGGKVPENLGKLPSNAVTQGSAAKKMQSQMASILGGEGAPKDFTQTALNAEAVDREFAGHTPNERGMLSQGWLQQADSDLAKAIEATPTSDFETLTKYLTAKDLLHDFHHVGELAVAKKAQEKGYGPFVDPNDIEAAADPGPEGTADALYEERGTSSSDRSLIKKLTDRLGDIPASARSLLYNLPQRQQDIVRELVDDAKTPKDKDAILKLIYNGVTPGSLARFAQDTPVFRDTLARGFRGPLESALGNDRNWEKFLEKLYQGDSKEIKDWFNNDKGALATRKKVIEKLAGNDISPVQREALSHLLGLIDTQGQGRLDVLKAHTKLVPQGTDENGQPVYAADLKDPFDPEDATELARMEVFHQNKHGDSGELERIRRPQGYDAVSMPAVSRAQLYENLKSKPHRMLLDHLAATLKGRGWEDAYQNLLLNPTRSNIEAASKKWDRDYFNYVTRTHLPNELENTIVQDLIKNKGKMGQEGQAALAHLSILRQIESKGEAIGMPFTHDDVVANWSASEDDSAGQERVKALTQQQNQSRTELILKAAETLFAQGKKKEARELLAANQQGMVNADAVMKGFESRQSLSNYANLWFDQFKGKHGEVPAESFEDSKAYRALEAEREKLTGDYDARVTRSHGEMQEALRWLNEKAYAQAVANSNYEGLHKDPKIPAEMKKHAKHVKEMADEAVENARRMVEETKAKYEEAKGSLSAESQALVARNVQAERDARLKFEAEQDSQLYKLAEKFVDEYGSKIPTANVGDQVDRARMIVAVQELLRDRHQSLGEARDFSRAMGNGIRQGNNFDLDIARIFNERMAGPTPGIKIADDFSGYQAGLLADGKKYQEAGQAKINDTLGELKKIGITVDKGVLDISKAKLDPESQRAAWGEKYSPKRLNQLLSSLEGAGLSWDPEHDDPALALRAETLKRYAGNGGYSKFEFDGQNAAHITFEGGEDGNPLKAKIEYEDLKTVRKEARNALYDLYNTSEVYLPAAAEAYGGFMNAAEDTVHDSFWSLWGAYTPYVWDGKEHKSTIDKTRDFHESRYGRGVEHLRELGGIKIDYEAEMKTLEGWEKLAKSHGWDIYNLTDEQFKALQKESKSLARSNKEGLNMLLRFRSFMGQGSKGDDLAQAYKYQLTPSIRENIKASDEAYRHSRAAANEIALTTALSLGVGPVASGLSWGVRGLRMAAVANDLKGMATAMRIADRAINGGRVAAAADLTRSGKSLSEIALGAGRIKGARAMLIGTPGESILTAQGRALAAEATKDLGKFRTGMHYLSHTFGGGARGSFLGWAAVPVAFQGATHGVHTAADKTAAALGNDQLFGDPQLPPLSHMWSAARSSGIFGVVMGPVHSGLKSVGVHDYFGQMAGLATAESIDGQIEVGYGNKTQKQAWKDVATNTAWMAPTFGFIYTGGKWIHAAKGLSPETKNTLGFLGTAGFNTAVGSVHEYTMDPENFSLGRSVGASIGSHLVFGNMMNNHSRMLHIRDQILKNNMTFHQATLPVKEGGFGQEGAQVYLGMLQVKDLKDGIKIVTEVPGPKPGQAALPGTVDANAPPADYRPKSKVKWDASQENIIRSLGAQAGFSNPEDFALALAMYRGHNTAAGGDGWVGKLKGKWNSLLAENEPIMMALPKIRANYENRMRQGFLGNATPGKTQDNTIDFIASRPEISGGVQVQDLDVNNSVHMKMVENFAAYNVPNRPEYYGKLFAASVEELGLQGGSGKKRLHELLSDFDQLFLHQVDIPISDAVYKKYFGDRPRQQRRRS